MKRFNWSVIPVVIILSSLVIAAVMPADCLARYEIMAEFSCADPAEDPHLSADPDVVDSALNESGFSDVEDYIRMITGRILLTVL